MLRNEGKKERNKKWHILCKNDAIDVGANDI